jgi:hypothetical protein
LALPPQSNEAFMREVDDAVRQDRLLGFWRRFGRWIVAAVILGLVAFAAWLWWDEHSNTRSGETGEDMAQLVDIATAGGTPDAKKVDALVDAGQPGYRAGALFVKAAAAAQKGDSKTAIATYAQIAADEKLDQPWRDLALVKQTALEFDQMKPDAVVDRMKPLAVSGEPWFGTAGEMVAIAYMKMKRQDLAGPMYAAMAKDEKVPASIRSRARQMAGVLGIDAVEIPGEDGAVNAGS